MAENIAKMNRRKNTVSDAKMEPQMDHIMSPSRLSNIRYRKDLYGNTVIVDEDDDEDGGDSATSG